MNEINSSLFVVTVDTESDNAWDNPETIKLENIRKIPKFQELCEKYQITPTYLITYECAVNEESIDILKSILEREKCEIGHHLHVWSTPPFQKPNFYNNIDLAWIHAYQYELPDSLFYEKSENLRETIKKNFGIYPTCHRSGRWGVDQRTINWLIRNNFQVDSSVVPFRDYSNYKGKEKGGPNFAGKPVTSHLWKNENGDSLVEIPVSVYYPFNYFKTNFFRKKKLGIKIGNRFNSGKSLTIDPTFSKLFYQKFISYEFEHQHIINLALHSSELAIDCSPYTDSHEKYVHVWSNIENVFKIIYDNGIKSITLTNAAEIIRTNLINFETTKIRKSKPLFTTFLPHFNR